MIFGKLSTLVRRGKNPAAHGTIPPPPCPAHGQASMFQVIC